MFATVLDIDGVLMKDRVPIPGAREALSKLDSLSVPRVFVSNGGGRTEAGRAAELSHELGVPVSEDQR